MQRSRTIAFLLFVSEEPDWPGFLSFVENPA